MLDVIRNKILVTVLKSNFMTNSCNVKTSFGIPTTEIVKLLTCSTYFCATKSLWTRCSVY